MRNLTFGTLQLSNRVACDCHEQCIWRGGSSRCFLVVAVAVAWQTYTSEARGNVGRAFAGIFSSEASQDEGGGAIGIEAVTKVLPDAKLRIQSSAARTACEEGEWRHVLCMV